jgi:hypothetical protein
MPTWLQYSLAVLGLLCPWVAGYFGVQRGMSVGLAVHGDQIRELQAEVLRLRESKHTIAQRVTEHEAWIDVLKRKAGVG